MRGARKGVRGTTRSIANGTIRTVPVTCTHALRPTRPRSQRTDPLPSPSILRDARRIAPASAALSLLFIVLATLIPVEDASPRLTPFCLSCGQFGTPDVVLNLLLFAPLGFVLGRAGIRLPVILILGVGLSGGIEALQLMLPGRSSTLRDVLTNALGGVLGGLVAIHLHALIVPGRRALALLWIAVPGFLAAVGLTGTLLQFGPPPGLYFGQWVPRTRHLEEWTGTVHEAYVSGIPVSTGPSDSSARLRTSLVNSAHFRMSGTAGGTTRRLGGIFRLVTDTKEDVLLIGQDRGDLVVSVRRRSEVWRLTAPQFRFRDALSGVKTGSPLTIEFAGTPLGACASVNGVRHCVGRRAAGGTWALAQRLDRLPARAQRLLDALTLFVLALPFGLLLRSAPRRQAVTASATILLGFPAIAWWSGLAFPALWDWTGLLLAVVIGTLCNVRLRRPSLSASASQPWPGTPTPR